MKRTIILVVAIVFATTMLAMAQYNDTEILGVHNVGGNGCFSCHSPHNGADAYGNNVGPGEITGETYLWDRAFRSATINTFDGASITNAEGTDEANTAAHTWLCLSCHDGATTANVMNSAWDSVASTASDELKNDHPVHAIYQQGQWTSGGNVWALIEKNGRFSFIKNLETPGSKLRFFRLSAGAQVTTGLNTVVTLTQDAAMVECATCHNPHSQSNAYTLNDTSYFLRDPYNSNRTQNASFCRGCHFSKSVYSYTNKPDGT